MSQGTLLHTSQFSDTVTHYWDNRAASYSNGVRNELVGGYRSAWKKVLADKLDLHKKHSSKILQILDLGCGPGFFSVLLAGLGCEVMAVDASEEMLAMARQTTASLGCSDNVSFLCGDVSKLPFETDSYDAIVLRNVTWLMEDPKASYAEWKRVLHPGGKLLAFDANWYSYLANDEIDRRRRLDQADSAILNWSEDAFASDSQERQCEEIARNLPLTYVDRPEWDARTLADLGFSYVSTDTEVFRKIWSPGEQSFYSASPLFAIEAIK